MLKTRQHGASTGGAPALQPGAQPSPAQPKTGSYFLIHFCFLWSPFLFLMHLCFFDPAPPRLSMCRCDECTSWCLSGAWKRCRLPPRARMQPFLSAAQTAELSSSQTLKRRHAFGSRQPPQYHQEPFHCRSLREHTLFTVQPRDASSQWQDPD